MSMPRDGRKATWQEAAIADPNASPYGTDLAPTPGERVAGRELDALVAEKVMGWRPVLHYGERGTGYWTIEPHDYETVLTDGDIPHYSTDIAAAMLIAHHAYDIRAYFRLELDADGVWWSQFGAAKDKHSRSLPLAICYAALAYAELRAAPPTSSQ